MFKIYHKTVRSFKNKAKYKIAELQDKAKKFLMNFIYNCIIMALETTEEREENGKKQVFITNVKLLLLLSEIVKYKRVFNDTEWKMYLIAFLKTLKEYIDDKDNINSKDFLVVSQFKKILVARSKLHVTEKIEDFEEKFNEETEKQIKDEEKQMSISRKSQEEDSKTDKKKKKTKSEKKKKKKDKKKYNETGIDEDTKMKKTQKDY